MIHVDSNALVYLLHDVRPKSNLVIDVLPAVMRFTPVFGQSKRLHTS